MFAYVTHLLNGKLPYALLFHSRNAVSRCRVTWFSSRLYINGVIYCGLRELANVHASVYVTCFVFNIREWLCFIRLCVYFSMGLCVSSQRAYLVEHLAFLLRFIDQRRGALWATFSSSM